MRQAINTLSRRIANMLARGVLTLAESAGKMQTMQVSLLADEGKTAVEHFEPYGWTSRPQPGAEVLVAFVEGDRSHGIVLCAADRRYRVTALQPGEVAIHDDQGAAVVLGRNGIVINGGTRDIHITGAPQVIVTGGDVIADGISLKNHKHGGVQAGSAETGVPV